MKVIDEKSQTIDPISVMVFSDMGFDKGQKNLAISDLLQGQARSFADKWLKAKGIRGAAIIKSAHPFPVNAAYEHTEDEDTEDKVAIGYMMEVRFAA